MNASKDNTYAHRLDRYHTYVSAASLSGVALLGLVACVAAGALENAPAILLPWFFFTVCLGAIPIALCRFSSQNSADRIRILVDDGTVKLDDSLRPQHFSFSPSTHFHTQLCLVSVLIPAFILVNGIWISLIDPSHSLVKNTIVGAFVCPILALILVSFRSFFRQRPKSNPASKNSPLDSVPNPSPSPAQTPFQTCAHLLKIFASCAERAKIIGLALLGQVTCVAAGALTNAPAVNHSAFFTAVLSSACVLGIYRLSCEQATRRIEREINDGTIQLSDLPRLAHVVPILILDVNVFYRCMTVPPLLLLTGICTSLFQLSTPVTYAFVVVFLGSWFLDFFKALWKLSQYR